MVAVVLADAAAAAPAGPRNADLVEERADILRRDVDKRLDAAPGGRDFGIAGNGIEDCRSPVRERAVHDAAVQVDAAQDQVRPDIAELDADAAALAVDEAAREVRGFGAGSPGRRIVCL